jgi:hypothetical protein
MTLPTYDPTKHDISLDGYGFMVATGDGTTPASLARTDSEPATSRAAIGDGGSENFTLSSYHFQTDVEGGVGQVILASADRGMTARAETRFQGHIFPPKKVLTTGSVGAASSGYFREGSTLYGVRPSVIENITSGASGSTGGTLTVRTGQKPRTSAALSTFWTTTALTLIKKLPSGALTDTTANLPTGVTPYLFDLYTRFAWVVGKRTLESSSGIAQAQGNVSAVAAATSTITIANRPQAQNTLVLIEMYESNTITSETPDGWALRENYVSTNFASTINVWTLQNPTSEDRSVRLVHSAGITHYGLLLEVKGVDADASFIDIVGVDYATGTAVASRPSGVLASATTGFNLVATFNQNNAAAFTPPTNYTELSEGATSASWRYHIAYRADTTDTTTGSVTPSTTTGGQATVLLKLKSNSIVSDLDQTVFLYSADDGATWEEAFNGDSAGMPLPTASLAAMGSLWLTTEYGLYEFRSEDVSLDSGESRVLNAVRGPMDEFAYPHGTSYIGTALANFDGSLYYNLGATLRRFPPGGRAEQIWPPRGWSISGGNVISVVSGEGGIYFGTDDGFLWNYDGRGFHQIAEATADQLSVLHWHAGKLYLKGDPAPYFEYGYPSPAASRRKPSSRTASMRPSRAPSRSSTASSTRASTPTPSTPTTRRLTGSRSARTRWLTGM